MIGFCTTLKNECKDLLLNIHSRDRRIQSIVSIVLRLLGPLLSLYSTVSFVKTLPNIAFSPLSLITSIALTSLCYIISFDCIQIGLNLKHPTEKQEHPITNLFSKIKHTFLPSAEPKEKLALFKGTLLFKPFIEKLIQSAFN